MAAIIERKRWDLLVILTAEPYGTDVLTTTLRLAQAVLARGRTVRFWACGYNTMLTQASLGEVKPINVRDPDAVYPSTAAVIHQMLDEHGRRMSWLACTVCSAERGVGAHIPQVRLRSALRFSATVAAADHVVYVGGA
jgi:sulfur relay (sulfurtransferase) complex TusBCD TusD component (DsrE family)